MADEPRTRTALFGLPWYLTGSAPSCSDICCCSCFKKLCCCFPCFFVVGSLMIGILSLGALLMVPNAIDVHPTETYDQVLPVPIPEEPISYNSKNISMFDPGLFEEIRYKWIMENSLSEDSTYALEHPEVRDPSMGQAKRIMQILRNKASGFFIECRAYDGETRSNTLVLERFSGWSGLLIEADPINFSKMVSKNRKAYMSPTCLSVKPHPMTVSFPIANKIGQIDGVDDDDQRNTVQCFPLASYVSALGVETVDYFSLNVEGSEMKVLKTIPFDQVDISTLSVACAHGKRSGRKMINFMAKKGYRVYGSVRHEQDTGKDIIFVKKSIE